MFLLGCVLNAFFEETIDFLIDPYYEVLVYLMIVDKKPSKGSTGHMYDACCANLHMLNCNLTHSVAIRRILRQTLYKLLIIYKWLSVISTCN